MTEDQLEREVLEWLAEVGYTHLYGPNIAHDGDNPERASYRDVLLTMPLLADKGWFVHAYNGRVRACTADGASVTGERPAPRCTNWSE